MAASADVKQLLLQVDASVSLAQRNLADLSAQVARETRAMEGNLDRPSQAAERMGQRFQQQARGTTASLGQMRAASQQLAFQIGDISQGFAMGVRPMTIFAQQSGQVIQAFTLMGGSSNKFLSFLGGPWGAVLTGALIVLTPLVSKLFEGSSAVDDLVDKMRKQADQARNNKAADEAWKTTIEGLTEAINKRVEAQRKALQTDIQAEEAALAAARGGLGQAERQRESIARQLADAKRELAAARASPGIITPGATAPGQDRVAALSARVESLRQQLAQTMTAARTAEEEIRNAEITIGERRVASALDASTAATDNYTRALGRLREERRLGRIDQAEFERQLQREAQIRDRAIEAARQANRTPSQTRNRQGVYSDFVSALGDQGVTPTSGYRTQAQQDALRARLGSDAARFSQHTQHRAVDVNINVSDDRIMAAAAQAGLRGVRIQAKPNARGGPHKHVSWTGAGDAGDPRGVESIQAREQAARERAEREAAAEAERMARALAQFHNDRIQNEENILQMRIAASGSISEQAELEHQLLRHQRDQADAALQERRRRGELDDAQLAHLRTQQAMIFAGRHAVVIQNEQNRLASEQLRQFTHIEGLQRDRVQGELQFARTQDERRRLELELIDIAYRIRAAELERARQAELSAGRMEEANRIQDQINRLPEERARDERGAMERTRNPLEAWADTVPRTAAEVNEALQTIQAQGLKSIEDGLTGVVMGTESLGDAFRNIANQIVADIIRMTVRMALFRAMSAAMPGLFGAGGGGSGGGIVPGGGLSSDPGVIFGNAGGGSVYAGVPTYVGEQGKEVFVPKTPGTIIPNHSLGRSAGPQEVVVRVVGTEMFDVKIERTSAGVVARAAPHIVRAAANSVTESISKPRLS